MALPCETRPYKFRGIAFGRNYHQFAMQVVENFPPGSLTPNCTVNDNDA